MYITCVKNFVTLLNSSGHELRNKQSENVSFQNKAAVKGFSLYLSTYFVAFRENCT